jgi:hypothetical protein
MITWALTIMGFAIVNVQSQAHNGVQVSVKVKQIKEVSVDKKMTQMNNKKPIILATNRCLLILIICVKNNIS